MSKVYFSLASGSFLQDWSNAGLITTDDNWSGVPSIEGFRGDDITAATGVDPRLLTGDGTITLDIIANQINPNTLTAGGVAEFAIANPTVALNGSGTADAPHLILYLDASGRETVHLEFDARDLDGSADNAAQQLVVQFRVGETGSWTNVPGGYLADVTSGPSLATLVTHVAVDLPAVADGAAQLQVRIMTTNAAGNDEWVGIDNIVVSSAVGQGPVNPAVNLSVSANAGSEAGTTAITVTATASSAVTGAQTVNLGVSGTGITAGDFQLSSTAITIPDGGTIGTVTFTVVDDVIDEVDETATLSLFGPSAGITLGAITTQNIVIADNDDPLAVKIHDIQGSAHRSPLVGASVAAVPGIVTAVVGNGFYLQDPNPDADPATSEALFVFTSSPPSVSVGHALLVSGTVTEFRVGGNVDNLTITEITGPTIQVQSTGNALPVATVLGLGGRSIPNQVIYNDAPTNAEAAGGDFDPAVEGIDFWESLEGMRVQVNNAVSTSPTVQNGSSEELWVLADNGAGATSVTSHGGSLITATDFNPERIQLDDLSNSAITFPDVDVGTRLNTVIGIVNYDFSNYEVLLPAAPTVTQASTLQREVTALAATAEQLTVATFNVENLDPSDGSVKFNALAAAIVNNLRSPDIINLEEVQDNNGAANDSTVSADVTLQTLINAIAAAGGPTYQYRQVNPLDDTNGGEPGGNIRVAFLFNPDRVSFVDRAGGTATSNTTVSNVGGQPVISASPGLIDPTNPAFSASRKPLVGEFTFNGETVFVIGNHFNSKGGDDPLFGFTQPPVLSSEAQRMQQAAIVKTFVQNLQAVDPAARVIVAGDLNDFEFSNPLTTLESAGLTSLIETLPANERYSYNFEGNAQTLDHLMASSSLLSALDGYDVVHINSEFASQVSDHDPVVARFNLPADLVLSGGGGRDILVGGSGDDRLAGGGGRDKETGGAGADAFVVNSLLDFFDVIDDFKVTDGDHFDLSGLLASLPTYSGSNPVDAGYLSVSPLSVVLPGGLTMPVMTVVLFDADGPGPDVPRPMAVLLGVAIFDAHDLLLPEPV